MEVETCNNQVVKLWTAGSLCAWHNATWEICKMEVDENNQTVAILERSSQTARVSIEELESL